MNDWMNYVYMQKQKPADTTGVQVTFTAIDPNNNYVTIGTTTSDINGNYGFTWSTPDVPGSYKIIASFSGSGSYWGSTDSTYMNIVSPAAATTAPTQSPQSAADLYFIPAIIGVIIAIIVVGAVLALLVTKKA
jgi:hypothetical protein